MAVNVIRGVEGEEGADPHRERSQHIVDNVEVQMGIARALRSYDSPGRVFDRKLRLHDSKTWTLLHALEHAIHARFSLALHALTIGLEIILLARAFFRPTHWDPLVLSVGVQPAHILIRSLPERFLADTRHLFYSPEEVCDLSHQWPREERYELGSQVRRSSNSSPAQLAEKHDDRHVRNKIEGVNRSRGEAGETIHHLFIAKLKSYIDEAVYRSYRSRYKECIRMLNGLERSLEKHLPESDRRWPARGEDPEL